MNKRVLFLFKAKYDRMIKRISYLKLRNLLPALVIIFLLYLIVIKMNGTILTPSIQEEERASGGDNGYQILPPDTKKIDSKGRMSNLVSQTWKQKLESLGDRPVSQELQTKREFVKQMMKDCWDTYVKYGFGSNELDVVKKRGIDRFQIYLSLKGLTIIDSLDTLLIMGLYSEYLVGRNWVENKLEFNSGQHVNLFESNIRVLGGLLSTYYLTKDQLYLDKAKQFADLTLYAFSSVFPSNRIPLLKNGNPHSSNSVGLAEIGTLHLEYSALTHLTKVPTYLEKVMAIRNKLRDIFYSVNSPLAKYFDVDTFTMHGSYSIGSETDSFYEYLLKSNIQDVADDPTLKFFSDSIERLDQVILARTANNYLYYRTGSVMEHLTCFTGGMFALASTIPYFSDKNYLQRGRELTETCYRACVFSKTGLCPDAFNPDTFIHKQVDDNAYYLRPEIMESIFYMYRVTGEKIYQEMAWNLTVKIDEHCRFQSGGFSSISNVNANPTNKIGTQESFFMAETLKYAYLIFSDPGFISLKEWVFNTEAHPLLINK